MSEHRETIGGGAKIVLLLLCLAGLLLLLSACGSGSSSTSEGAEASPPSMEFTKRGGENKPATFGELASEKDREMASRMLAKNLQARAAGNWAGQCATLTAAVVAKIESEARKLHAGNGCAKSLKAEAEPLSRTKAIRANTLTGPIDVFRVKGKSAYALYHGTKGKDYAMPLEMEGGGWKVAALVTTEIP
jgi:hypothetical protein